MSGSAQDEAGSETSPPWLNRAVYGVVDAHVRKVSVLAELVDAHAPTASRSATSATRSCQSRRPQRTCTPLTWAVPRQGDWLRPFRPVTVFKIRGDHERRERRTGQRRGARTLWQGGEADAPGVRRAAAGGAGLEREARLLGAGPGGRAGGGGPRPWLRESAGDRRASDPARRSSNLGSGAGFDCFLAAKRVGPGGDGHRRRHDAVDGDQGPEQRQKAGIAGVEFRLGRDRAPSCRGRDRRTSYFLIA